MRKNKLASADLTEHTDGKEQNSVMSKEIETYNPTDDVVVYRSADNAVQLDVQLAEETVWLTQQQIATLFQKAISTISYHITNIFKEGELDEKVAIRKIRNTTPHGAIKGKVQTK